MTQLTTEAVDLDTPITRGNETITALTLRKPGAGELRGCSLVDLLRMDVGALITVLPRITTPALTEHDVRRMDPADLLQLGTKVSDFLLPKAAKGEESPTESKTPQQTLQ